MDRLPHLTCCQTVDPDVVETEDPEAFDCDTCPLREAEEALWPENADAWDVYLQMSRRFVRDHQLGAEVFRAQTSGRDADDVADLMDRLTLIDDLVNPPKVPDGA